MATKGATRKYGSMKKARETRNTWTSKSVKLPDGMNFFSVEKAGPKFLDFLPYQVKEKTEYANVGDWFPQKTFFVHRGVGPNNDTYCCLRKNWNKPCPICEELARMQQSEDADDDTLQALKPKERHLWLVKDLKDQDKGIQVWDVSRWLFGEALDDFLTNADEGDRYDEFWYPEGGMTIKVGFKEKRYAGATYYDSSSIEIRPRKAVYGDDVLSKLPCLDELIIVTPYNALKAAFQAFVPDEDDSPEIDDELSQMELPWDKDEEGDNDEEKAEVPDEADPIQPPKKRGRPAKKEKPKEDKEDGWDEDDWE